jgi:signal transduction histidine kinase
LKEKGKKVLICDDNVEFLRTVAEMIRLQGYEPIMTKTGRQAMEKAINLAPDLVLLDHRLPDMDGTVVLSELKKIDNGIPVIIMTAFGDEKLAAEVIKLGAMDYLVKPFKRKDLLVGIENTLKKAEEIKKKQELEKLVLWGKLFPLVAHEIRTPLHSIGGALTLIRNRHQSDPTTTRALQIIHEEIVRLNEFVNQCLDFSRSPSRDSFNPINLNEAVNSCVQLMTPFLQSEVKKLQVVTKLDDSAPPVHANLDEIKQVLMNLLRNAAEAIRKDGRIVVETRFRREGLDESVEIRVSDTGTGVSEKDLANVFTPFFSRKRNGIGLGLAICRRIVEENHRGRIQMERQPSEGTTVRVTLPIGLEEDGPEEGS